MRDLWTSMGFKWAFTWCGVGSREVPEELIPFLRWVGHCMALMDGVLFTGDALGSDLYFTEGYNQGRQAHLPPAQIYFTKLKNQRGLPHSPMEGFHEAEQYETYEEAKALAFKARGSFEGLFASGIGLHTRNAFQVLSHTLDKPVWVTLFYAQPVGKKGLVKGGTNTAVQISIMHNVKRINLYTEEERKKFAEWVMAQLVKRDLPVPKLGIIEEPQHGGDHPNADHHPSSGHGPHPDIKPLVCEGQLRTSAGEDSGQSSGVVQPECGPGEEPLLAAT